MGLSDKGGHVNVRHGALVAALEALVVDKLTCLKLRHRARMI
jgi:hypothetical protein